MDRPGEIGRHRSPRLSQRDAVAVILAFGLVTALNLVTAAVLWDALRRDTPSILSENAVQVLTGAFGGIIGVLGSVLGYRAGERHNGHPDDTREP